MGWYKEHFGELKRDVYFTGEIAPPVFLNCGSLSATEMQKLIMPITLPEFAPGVYDQRPQNHIPKVSDNRYKLTTWEAIEKLMEWWVGFNWLQYEAEDSDCDDFAGAFFGITKMFRGWSLCPFLYIESYPNPIIEATQGHAYIIGIGREDIAQESPITIKAIEPQNGQIALLTKGQLIDYQIREFMR